MDSISTGEQPAQTVSREQRFVEGVIELCQHNKGDAARLRRADNPATEYQSWEFLAAWGINLEKEWERLPYVTVAAAMARAKLDANGTVSLGVALANCYEDKQNSNQGKMKLRRLLACDDIAELARHLRPILTLIQSKKGPALDYTRLLRQLRSFFWHSQRIKAAWAQEFYGQVAEQKDAQMKTETSP